MDTLKSQSSILETPSLSLPSPAFPRISRSLKWSPFIPHVPTPKQLAFLLLDQYEEAFYGGAAGGGKSDALLMGALQYADVPGYAALVLRRTFKALTLPEALLDRARMWLGGTGAKWNSDSNTWIFPSGAKVVFGYLENDRDVEQYQSAAFQYIGFDELTQFSEYQYRYMHSRTRRLEGSDIPIRMRGASNPGSIGHDWVKIRFIVEGIEKGRPFIPAKLDDNPHLDQAAYIKSLNNLDPVTRDQLLRGDWSARTAGSKFRREWFKLIDVAPNDCKYVRYWDMAATEKKANTDPDWTAGAKVGRNPQGNFFISDMRHARVTPQSVEALITQTAQLDGKNTWIYMEQEPGASGKTLVDYYGRKVLQGYTFYPDKVTGDKSSRANPVSSQAEAGNVYIVKGAWINDYLDEAESFPTGAHDDQVDAVSGAFTQLVIPGNPEGMLRAMELIIEQRAKVGSKP